VYAQRISILIAFFLLWSCKKDQDISLPYYNTPDFTPHWFAAKEDAHKEITHQISSFSCMNQNGEMVSEKNMKGNIYVANFFFTSCPSICPKMTTNFERIQDAFRNEDKVKLLSHSVTPWIDSVSRLKEYSQLHGAIDGKWNLLTGDRSTIYTLARQSYFAEEEPGFTKDSVQFLHTENFVLVDGSGRIRGLYKGTVPLDAERLIDDIKILLKEK
jgi:protein SCO1/2